MEVRISNSNIVNISDCVDYMYKERSIPRPPGLLTDRQVRMISIIALGILLMAAGIVPLAGIAIGITGGAVGAVIMTTCLGIEILVPIVTIFRARKAYDSLDLQTRDNAMMVRHDLRTRTLTELHKKYNFDDLTYYGYISFENALQMDRLYTEIPKKPVKYVDREECNLNYGFKGRMYSEGVRNEELSNLVDKALYNPEKRRLLNEQFEALRNLPGFVLYNSVIEQTAGE